jgi:TonB family protein
MVPPEELELNAPTTLPADFGEWDSGEDPGAQPAQPAGFDGFPGSGVAPKPVAKSVTARAAALPPVSRPVPAPTHRQAAHYAEAEQVYHQPQYQAVKAASSKQKVKSPETGKSKKGLVAVAASVLLLLALGSLGYSRMRSGAATAKPAAAPTTTTLTNPQTLAAATETSATTQVAAAETTETDRPLRAQSEAMNRQLSAPSRIPNDLKMLAGKEAPPVAGFGDSGLGAGMGASNVFAGAGTGPKVKIAAPTKVSVSAGVAVGLIMQKTAPVYPAIARSARVSGTVVIQATISRSGQVVNPRVVSGPTMLRQAAVDAVKTWRFRPYLLDGEPVEVDTTVNVVFTL